ncbi:FAD-dependent monooxygenase [Rossellomorea marisflavi]|uniref:FAD-dependent monooxygenase n=1 Tax=Rossellomorea marisflavi TaxID=189381 RepID=UPI00325C12A7
MKTDVLISGGGIGGLTLALKLARCGIDVTVIERLPGPSPVYKGELLQPKSLEIFDSLGVIEPVLSHGHRIAELELMELKGKRAEHSSMSYSILPGKYPYSLMIHHEKLKDILRAKGGNTPAFTIWGTPHAKRSPARRSQWKTGVKKNPLISNANSSLEQKAGVLLPVITWVLK